MKAIVSLRLHLLIGLVAVLANGRTWAQADTFDDGNDTEWSRYNPLGVFGASATYSFPAGSYRFRAPPSPDPLLLGPQRAGSLRTNLYTRVSVATDVTGWDNTLNQSVGLVARVQNAGLGTTAGYTFNYNTRSGFFQIYLVANELPARSITESLFRLNPAEAYRFVFTVFGNNLLGQAFSTNNAGVPIQSLLGTDDTYTAGTAGVFAFAIDVAGGIDARFDNYQARVPPQLRATVMQVTPGPGEILTAASDTLTAQLADLETSVKPDSIRLEVDGSKITPEVSSAPPFTTITYTPENLFSTNTLHAAKLTYVDDLGPRTIGWSFGPKPLLLAPSLEVATDVIGAYHKIEGVEFDASNQQFTVPLTAENRFFRLRDSTARRVTTPQVTAGKLVIRFE